MATLDELPLLLAGPILRRAEAKEIAIWVATLESIRAADVSIVEKPPKGRRLKTVTKVDQQQLGKKLHVALLLVTPAHGEFPKDVLLGYTLSLTFAEKHTLDSLVSGDVGLAYPGLGMPSLYLSSEKPRRLLHASCRKPHAEGLDALRALDERMAHVASKLEDRPSVLFLTGDQIYADDVAQPLLEHLTAVSAELLGWDEQIPTKRGAKLVKDIAHKDREDFVRREAAFTTTASGHLVGFGEFCAMYLAVWSPDLFPKLEADAADTKTEKHWFTGLPVSSLTSRYWLRQFGETLPYVRRLLANAPTYMIFDDHEITDDWNLRGEWERKMRRAAAGRRIVANGLAAYWAFQAWGNDRSKFDTDFRRSISDYLDLARSSGPKRAETRAGTFEDTLLDFHGWEFFARTSPRSVFIDCRTRREYDDPLPPQILGDDGLDAMKRTAEAAGYQRGEPLVIVSSLPVYTVWLGELVAEKVLVPRGGPVKWDHEAWRANPWGFARFMSYIVENLRPSHCVFLGGDVHFAFSVEIRYVQHWRMWDHAYQPDQDSSGAARPAVFTQLTSSAAKNEEKNTRETVGKYLGSVVKLLGGIASVAGTAFLGPAKNSVNDIAVETLIREFSVTDFVGAATTMRKTPAIRSSLDEPHHDTRIHERRGHQEPETGEVRVWEHELGYVPTDPLDAGSSTIYGENNAGEVHIRTNDVEHTLWNWKDDRARGKTTSVSISSRKPFR